MDRKVWWVMFDNNEQFLNEHSLEFLFQEINTQLQNLQMSFLELKLKNEFIELIEDQWDNIQKKLDCINIPDPVMTELRRKRALL